MWMPSHVGMHDTNVLEMIAFERGERKQVAIDKCTDRRVGQQDRIEMQIVCGFHQLDVIGVDSDSDAVICQSRPVPKHRQHVGYGNPVGDEGYQKQRQTGCHFTATEKITRGRRRMPRTKQDPKKWMTYMHKSPPHNVPSQIPKTLDTIKEEVAQR